MALYVETGKYFCFGCGAKGLLAHLDLDVENLPAFEETNIKFVENIDKTMEYIDSLPKKVIRGHELPYDADYYYLVWPDKSFYKKRLHDKNAKSKYRSPVGIRKPLYKHRGGNKGLIIVEGEFNALTVASVPDTYGYAIVSPGPVTDFMRKDYLRQYLQYDTILVIVDRDAAGVCAGLELQAHLRVKGKSAFLYPMVKDFNDILTENGKDEVQKETQKSMAVLRMRGNG